MYKELYDAKHKLIKLKPHDLLGENPRIQNPSLGEYEGGILCEDCDNKIGKLYEDYASKVLRGGSFANGHRPEIILRRSLDGAECTEINKISYAKFKLFLLSILWRSHISTRPMFAEVSIGIHAETIRRMIYEENPGEVNDYPILVLSYANDQKMPIDMIAQPLNSTSVNGTPVVIFIIGGNIYIYYLVYNVTDLPDYVKFSTINPQNQMNVFHIPEGEAWTYLNNYYGFTSSETL